MTLKHLIPLVAVVLTFVSCSQDAPEIPSEEIYLREFIKKFGPLDPAQDWNTASRVTAVVDASAVKDASEIRVYTAPVSSPDSRLVARYAASVKSFSFDFPEHLSTAYAVTYDSDGRRLRSLTCRVNDGKIDIKAPGSRAPIDDTPYQAYLSAGPSPLGDPIADLGTLKDEAGRFPDLPKNSDGSIDRAKLYSMYHNPQPIDVARLDGAKWEIDELLPLMGKDGILPEGDCNLTKWEDVLIRDKGIELVTSEVGPVSLGIMAGGTQHMNKYGYLYYSSDKKDDKNYIARQNRYILIENGNPNANIKTVKGAFVQDMQIPTFINFHEEGQIWPADNFPLTGARYYLTYYGEDGTTDPTFEFPAGTHIVFFEIYRLKKDENEENIGSETSIPGENVCYSVPWMNEWTGHMRSEAAEHIPKGSNMTVEEYAKEPLLYFMGFGYKRPDGTVDTFVGAEDGNDHDMNDIMFIANGHFEEDLPVLHEGSTPDDPFDEEPEAQSWIVAVEDLGNSDDYDFNDVVLEVKHVSGETKAQVRMLAAGGRLLSRVGIRLDGASEATMLNAGNHVNAWFGENDHSVFINVGYEEDRIQDGWIEIDVPADFTMTENMGGFVVEVEQTDGKVHTIEALPRNDDNVATTPWMICVDGSWSWPCERISIETAYPAFKEWLGDHTKSTDWWKTPAKTSMVVKRTMTHPAE